MIKRSSKKLRELGKEFSTACHTFSEVLEKSKVNDDEELLVHLAEFEKFLQVLLNVEFKGLRNLIEINKIK